jgi:replicative DNA helicase
MTDTVQMSDPQTERAYVSALLADPTVSQRCRLEPSTLTVEALRAILIGVYACERHTGNWTLSSLEEALSRLKSLDVVGGVDVLRELIETADYRISEDPKPAAERIRALARRREEYETSKAITASLLTGDSENAKKLTQKLIELKTGAANEVEILTSHETTEAAYKYLVDFAENRRHIAFGIPAFDATVGRLPPGSMTVIGGSTSAGKSQTMLLSAMAMAKAGNRPGIISLEDAREEWGGRIIARLTGVTFRDFAEAKGRGENERVRIYSRAGEAVDLAAHGPFDIAYAISADLETVLESGRRLVIDRGCNVLFVDYIQAVRIGPEWSKRIDKGFADVAKKLKGFVARAKIPLIVGSQLSRSKDTPTIHSLKETGDLENEAEVVVLLWRTDEGFLNPAVRWKIGKIKWATARSNGVVVFNRSTGMIENFEEENSDENNTDNSTSKQWRNK